jgi:hypothetical protein
MQRPVPEHRAPLTGRVYRIGGDRLDFRVLLITKHVES